MPKFKHPKHEEARSRSIAKTKTDARSDDWREHFKLEFGRVPRPDEVNDWIRLGGSAQDVEFRCRMNVTDPGVLRAEKQPCGGVLRAEKQGASEVIIKGILYVPCPGNWASLSPLDSIPRTFPHMFVRGEMMWCLDWVAPVLAALKGKSTNAILQHLREMTTMTYEGKRQRILDLTMLSEFSKDEPINWYKVKSKDVVMSFDMKIL